MAWKVIGEKERRRSFVFARLKGKRTMRELCVAFGISRQCGYNWWNRFCAGGGWTERTRRPRVAERLRERWHERVLALRREHPYCGARKLVWHLEQKYRLGPWPSVRTIARWLRAAGKTKARKHRSRAGPKVVMAARDEGRAANAVWTVDFKGWFYTADGRRVCTLTVRDLATRYVLLVRHVAPADERTVARWLQWLFRRYGIPGAIRVDNGPPFGGVGPHGWSRLATGWIRLGIKVEYGRPGCPQDNAAHEQMHRVLKQQTASPPAPSLAAQQRRFARWRHYYNLQRPHEALNSHVPGALYQPGQYPAQLPPWQFPAGASLVRADARGRCHWAGRNRLIGRAFGTQRVALKPVATDVVEVYFGPHLLGELHALDQAGIRAVQLVRPSRQR
jgi:putative transposase